MKGLMKTKSSIERVKELSENHNRLRVAFWLLLGYSVLLSAVVYGVQAGLWEAVEANFEVLELRTRVEKLPCSSEINENCAIFVK